MNLQVNFLPDESSACNPDRIWFIPDLCVDSLLGTSWNSGLKISELSLPMLVVINELKMPAVIISELPKNNRNTYQSIILQ